MLVILSIWDFPDVFKDYVRKWATKPTNYLLRWNYFHKNKHFDRKESFDWRWHDSKQKTFQNRLLRISASLMKSKHFLCGTDFCSFFCFLFYLSFLFDSISRLLSARLYCSPLYIAFLLTLHAWLLLWRRPISDKFQDHSTALQSDMPRGKKYE